MCAFWKIEFIECDVADGSTSDLSGTRSPLLSWNDNRYRHSEHQLWSTVSTELGGMGRAFSSALDQHLPPHSLPDL